MRKIMVKDVMIPILDYSTIKETQTLFDAFHILKEAEYSKKSYHRDLIVVDEDGNFKGKVTMLDIFRSLEPNYKRLNINYTDGTLTKEKVVEEIKAFDLWMEPVKDLCERGAGKTISEVIHIPESYEYISEEDSLEKALHRYVMGVHQPLLVKNGEQVTGILRFEDLYKVISESMLTCKV